MNALTTRILKEVRPLLWPWCAGALPGALLLVYRLDRTRLIWLIGLLVVPLLATLTNFNTGPFPCRSLNPSDG
jgi:hypothetical protein